MKINFVLTMDDLVVGDEEIDQVILDWVDDVSKGEIMDVSQKWITTKNFLIHRMVGLTRVGESRLTIGPPEPKLAD